MGNGDDLTINEQLSFGELTKIDFMLDGKLEVDSEVKKVK